jgi:hypothetical protein
MKHVLLLNSPLLQLVAHSQHFVLQDFEHIVHPPALVALALGFHPVGAPVTSAASSNCLAVG